MGDPQRDWTDAVEFLVGDNDALPSVTAKLEAPPSVSHVLVAVAVVLVRIEFPEDLEPRPREVEVHPPRGRQPNAKLRNGFRQSCSADVLEQLNLWARVHRPERRDKARQERRDGLSARSNAPTETLPL